MEALLYTLPPLVFPLPLPHIQAALFDWLPEALNPSEEDLWVLSSGKDLKAVQDKGLPASKVQDRGLPA